MRASRRRSVLSGVGYTSMETTTSRLWSPPPEALELAPGVIHVWRAVLDLARAEVDAMRATLSADELERAARRRTVELQDRFIAGRGVLRALLGRYLGVDPAPLRFHYGAHGKP